ncbi:chaperonin [Aureococcus anophagefferens]|nr:chaperonin [Aureococcus anophagefferens]
MRSSTLSAWCAFAALASAFRPGPTSLRPPARRAAEASVNERSFTRQEALYDLVYVERLAPPQTSSGGLILLEPEDPPMHLARVVSVGDGAVGDSGAVTKNAGVAAGDLVPPAPPRTSTPAAGALDAPAPAPRPRRLGTPGRDPAAPAAPTPPRARRADAAATPTPRPRADRARPAPAASPAGRARAAGLAPAGRGVARRRRELRRPRASLATAPRRR